MAKRKAAAIEDVSPSKRHTRSHGPLIETQLDTPSRRTRSAATRQTKPTPAPSPSKNGRTRAYDTPRSGATSDELSMKENDGIYAEANDSEDELLLSPTKSRPPRPVTPPRKSVPRTFMHSVEIVTPGRKFTAYRNDSHSPAPTPRRRDTAPTILESPRRTRGSQATLSIEPLVALSPLKKYAAPHASRSQLSSTLPAHLHSCLNAQKRAILRALQNPIGNNPGETEAEYAEDEPAANAVALQQLTELLSGTVHRGEGNSCLLLGPRGSGKSRLVDRCLSNIADQPIIIRLSGWAQHNDRVAMREIAWQLSQQTGTTFMTPSDADADAEQAAIDEETNPFLDDESKPSGPIALPPPSHLPALISILPTLSRPSVVVLDAFDLFALHPRQSLLYCLLDTAQSCRAGVGSHGIAVVGVTSRVDTVNLLEKRVKSRFSGRTIRTAPPRQLSDWMRTVKSALCPSSEINEAEGDMQEWRETWVASVDRFLEDKGVIDTLNESFSISRDQRMLIRILVAVALQLSPSSPFPTAAHIISAAARQRSRQRFPHLHSLPYPSVCLLIASVHAQTAGHDTVTFELLHDCIRDQVRSSTSAPVQLNGGGIGMVRCTKEVFMSAFENLISTKIYASVAPPSESVAKEFVRYRFLVEREDVKKAVDRIGQTQLKKWFSKAH